MKNGCHGFEIILEEDLCGIYQGHDISEPSYRDHTIVFKVYRSP